jgi:hypothetical protein
MNPNTLRILFGLFLIAHGLTTMSLATVPVPAAGALHTPFFPAWWRPNVDNTWPASRLGLPDGFVRTAGWILWLGALVLLAAAGAGLFGLLGLHAIWQILAAVGAAASLLLLALYWHPWLILGLLINIFVLLGVYAGWFTRWFPSPS